MAAQIAFVIQGRVTHSPGRARLAASRRTFMLILCVRDIVHSRAGASPGYYRYALRGETRAGTAGELHRLRRSKLGQANGAAAASLDDANRRRSSKSGDHRFNLQRRQPSRNCSISISSDAQVAEESPPLATQQEPERAREGKQAHDSATKAMLTQLYPVHRAPRPATLAAAANAVTRRGTSARPASLV
jgi:hypothetical protein